MHPSLSVTDILLSILRHFLSPEIPSYEKRPRKADLAVLARTCRAFKEPALDALWEELLDLSPLARCLPEACVSSDKQSYEFRRPLEEAEWNVLRSYTRRVRCISQTSSSFGSLSDSAMTAVFTPTFVDPLFPNLRSLSWEEFTPSVVEFGGEIQMYRLVFCPTTGWPTPIPITTSLDLFGDHCPNVETVRVESHSPSPRDATISLQVCRWKNLRTLHCENVALSLDAISNLSSVSALRFALTADFDHSGPVLRFSNLADLRITSSSLGSITTFFSRTQLPVIRGLFLLFSDGGSKRKVQECNAVIRKACVSNTLVLLMLDCDDDMTDSDDHDLLHLTLDDIPQTFGDLRTMFINLPWSVQLTDSDLLVLVSTCPRLENLMINERWGWGTGDGRGGGITLSGLVQLLQLCPSLQRMALAIDTQTFTHIPDGLDVSFPPRELHLELLDSYIKPAFVSGLALVFTALGLGPGSVCACLYGRSVGEDADILWRRVIEGTSSNT